MDFIQLLIVSIFSLLVGYYMKSKVKELKILKGIEKSTKVIEKLEKNINLLDREKEIIVSIENLQEKEIKFKKEIEELEKEIEELKSDKDTAQHAKWKKEHEEAMLIVEQEKVQKLQMIKEIKAAHNKKIEEENKKTKKPDFLN